MAKDKKSDYKALPAEDEKAPADEKEGKSAEEVAPQPRAELRQTSHDSEECTQSINRATFGCSDAYAELIAAAKSVKRVRFRVMQNYNGNISAITMFLAAIIIAGSVIMSLAKNKGVMIGIAVVLVIAIIAAISAMIYQSAKAKRVYYCYYQNTDDGIFCMSVIEDRAVVYANGTAYRIDGEDYYTLDERGFLTYLDGECSGLLSILNARREDVEVEELPDGMLFTVKNRVGGGHKVFLENGEIVEITSEQPYKTDEVDAKTGESRVKTKMFIKVDPQEDFEWAVPEFVKTKLASMGVNVENVTPKK